MIAPLNNTIPAPIGWIGLLTTSDEPLQADIDVDSRHSRLILLDASGMMRLAGWSGTQG